MSAPAGWLAPADAPFPVGTRVRFPAIRGESAVCVTAGVVVDWPGPYAPSWRRVKLAGGTVDVRADRLELEGVSRYLCKACGAESPTGIGFPMSSPGALPAPASDCPHPHAD